MMTLRFFMLFLQRQYSYILLNHEQKWAQAENTVHGFKEKC